MNTMAMFILLCVGIVVLLVGALLFIFWIAMLVDCCRRKFDKGAERLIWLVVLLFTNLAGLVLYYLLIKKFNPRGLLDKSGHLR